MGSSDRTRATGAWATSESVCARYSGHYLIMLWPVAADHMACLQGSQENPVDLDKLSILRLEARKPLHEREYEIPA